MDRFLNEPLNHCSNTKVIQNMSSTIMGTSWYVNEKTEPAFRRRRTASCDAQNTNIDRD